MKVGELIENNAGDWALITAVASKTASVEFLGTEYRADFNKGNLRAGKFRDKLKRSYYGEGFEGVGGLNNGSDAKAHSIWRAMLSRCYNTKDIRYRWYGGCGVTVCEEWKNFQNFCTWYKNNHVKSWVLDKDILDNGSKKYSEDTCCFIPPKLSYFMKGKSESFKEGARNILKTRQGSYCVRVTLNNQLYESPRYKDITAAEEVREEFLEFLNREYIELLGHRENLPYEVISKAIARCSEIHGRESR